LFGLHESTILVFWDQGQIEKKIKIKNENRIKYKISKKEKKNWLSNKLEEEVAC
jgi:hypothetical protein